MIESNRMDEILANAGIGKSLSATETVDLVNEIQRLYMVVNSLNQEKALEFSLLDKAVGGTGLTPYQGEMCAALCLMINALREELSVLKAEKNALKEKWKEKPFLCAVSCETCAFEEMCEAAKYLPEDQRKLKIDRLKNGLDGLKG